MSAYRNLYDDVFDKTDSIEVIKTVQDYNEQYLEPENYNNVAYPACYIESGIVEWDKGQNQFYQYGKEPQKGTATIKVHVVVHTLRGFDKETKDIFYNISDLVSNNLQKLQSSPTWDGTYTTLMRVEEEYITPSSQLRVCVLTFETELTDIFLDDDVVEETVTAVIAVEQGLVTDPLKDENNVIIITEDEEMIFTTDSVKTSFVPKI